MKKIPLTLALCLCIAMPSLMRGEGILSEVSKTPPPKLIILKRKADTTTIRPKAPSLQQITCAYDGEALRFEFVIPEGECILTLTGGVNASCTFDSSELNAEIYVGDISDETELTLATEYGNQYSGTIEF